MAEMAEALSGYCRIVDDIIIYDSNIKDHILHVRHFLQHCAEKQIALNLQNAHSVQEKLGFRLSAKG